ncbi:retinol dehydrogenase 11-like [Penaeus japonicus]|uniref:retinol dehydrogenase 11-like n=1 Tax=Penaeus japonicus TaxID=27405 RepID=UPI001C70F22A|nr:retinol dehydrogenase 11-like [Penaeus japonicus]
MLLTTLALVLAFRLFYRFRSGRCRSKRSLVGKTVVVTGGSAGIGKEAAKDFLKRNARVILACRNLEKARKVAEELVAETGNPNVAVRRLDTADLASVRSFAEDFLRTEDSLHILVNNAGIAGTRTRQETEDGLELTMATNHFGHFLLTNLLLKRLQESAPSRVVTVSSAAHLMVRKLDPRDLNLSESYGSLKAYGLSKLCNILFATELAERLKGTGVTSNSLHPGAVATEFFIKEDPSRGWIMTMAGRVINFFVTLGGKDSELGAQTTIHLGRTRRTWTACRGSTSRTARRRPPPGWPGTAPSPGRCGK